MSLQYPAFRPALRTVNSAGVQVRAPLDLYSKYGSISTNGWYLQGWDVDYVPELLGEWMNTSYEVRWRLLGLRPMVNLRFACILTDPAAGDYGLTLLRKLITEGLSSETYAALQFNLFYNGAFTTAAWRGFRPASPINARKVAGKDGTFFEMDMDLKGRDLLPPDTVIDWAIGKW